MGGGEHPLLVDERAAAEDAEVDEEGGLVGELRPRRHAAVEDAQARLAGRGLLGLGARRCPTGVRVTGLVLPECGKSHWQTLTKEVLHERCSEILTVLTGKCFEGFVFTYAQERP